MINTHQTGSIHQNDDALKVLEASANEGVDTSSDDDKEKVLKADYDSP